MSSRWSKLKWRSPWPRKVAAKIGHRTLWSFLDQYFREHPEDPQLENGYRDVVSAEYAIVHGDVEHIFIPSAPLIEFLESAEVHDFSVISNYVTSHWLGMSVDPDLRYTYSVLHLPCPEKESLLVKYINDETSGRQEAVVLLNGKWEHASLSVMRYPESRLCINLLHYMAAFPECVTECAPEDHIDGWRPPQRKRLNAKMSIFEHGNISPHFRRGHFAVLRSERYKKKRGQTIFVRSTFVKGRAITVDDSPEKEQAFRG